MWSDRNTLLKVTDIVLAGVTVSSIAALLIYLWLSGMPGLASVPPEKGWFLLVVVLFGLNLLANLYGRLPRVKRDPNPPSSLIINALSTLGLMLMFTPGISTILWLLLVAQLSRYFSLRLCLAAAVVVPLLVGLYHQFIFGRPYALINVGLYTLFNLFVVFLGLTLESERKAREEASRLVTELRATQQLLASTSKRDERLRIARELHDLSGHHLAALSLQLEIARHTAGEKHDGAIERAGVIAHLLLSELRDTVSAFREHRGIDIREAVQTLTKRLPRPQVCLHIASDLRIDDVQVAETLLRSVQEALTNIVRHSQADQATISLTRRAEQVRLAISDNGGLKELPVAGNGLTGMRERIEQLRGQLALAIGANGLELDIELPLGNGLIV